MNNEKGIKSLIVVCIGVILFLSVLCLMNLSEMQKKDNKIVNLENELIEQKWINEQLIFMNEDYIQ